MSKTLSTVADLGDIADDVTVTFELTEVVSTTRKVEMTAGEVRALIEQDGWGGGTALTGDLDHSMLRDELSDAFGAGELVGDESVELNVNDVTVRR